MSDQGSFNHMLKVYGITKLKTDIIFMSDIRLCNARGITNILPLEQSFRVNPYSSYNFVHNSHSNKRGVGILLKNNCNFTILQEERDEQDNFILLRVTKSGETFVISSIYGPNRVCPEFFVELRNSLSRINPNNSPIVLGGDWNCTYSRLGPNLNPDMLNMVNLPNARHTDLLLNICEDLELADPFRTKNPNAKEFTVFPSDPLRKIGQELTFSFSPEQF